MHDWEKFRVRDEGSNEVGLHNDNHNRFLRMSSSTTETGHDWGSDYILDHGWIPTLVKTYVVNETSLLDSNGDFFVHLCSFTK